MPTITITQKNCTRCGSCLHVCPVRILHFESAQGPPCYIPGGQGRCILCGHCEAVCPTDALSLTDERLAPALQTEHLFPLSRTALSDQFSMRRSIRHFMETPVQRETLQDLLDLVRYAPSGTNSQQIQWLVIHSRDQVQRLTAHVADWMRHLLQQGHPIAERFNLAGMIKAYEKGNDPICRHAPHIIIAHADANRAINQVDGIIALTHVDLAAPSFGLGCCWAGFFQYACEGWPPLQEALGLPTGHQTIYALLVGTPAIQYQRPPKRNHGIVRWLQ